MPVEGLEPNHSKDVLEETDDLWDYFDEKRNALERFENYHRRPSVPCRRPCIGDYIERARPSYMNVIGLGPFM